MVSETERYFDYFRGLMGQDRGLNFLILYTTSKCNLKCTACFFHQQLNKTGDLTLEEYKQIARAVGKVSLLLLSGGEPFLNPDLIAICSAFIENCGVNSLLVPTNATMTDRVIDQTKELLQMYPNVSISINPSIDGMRNFHDRERGVEGVFDKAIATIEALSKLKGRYPNLQIVVNSVVRSDNLNDLQKLMVYLRKFNLDFHAFELLRGDPKDKSLALPSLAEVKKMHRLVLKNRNWYLSRAGKKQSILARWLEKVLVLGALRYGQVYKERSLEGKRWPAPCQAGKKITAIYPNGDLALCELLPTVGNVRTANYDIGKMLRSNGVQSRIRRVDQANCDCTHICFVHSAIASDFKSILAIPYYYLRALHLLKNA